MKVTRRPAELSTVLDNSLRFVRRELAVLAPWAALMGVLWSSPVLLQQAALSAIGGFGSGVTNPAAMMAFAVLSNVTGMVGLGLYFAGQFAIYTAVFHRLEGRPISWKTMARGAVDWRLWVVGILEGMINFAGILLCGLPQLYLFPVLQPSFAIVLHEDVHAAAIKRCFQLVHHKAQDVTPFKTWGRVVGVLHVIYFVQWALAAFTAAPVLIVMFWRVFRAMGDGSFTPEMMQTAALLPLWIQVPVTLIGGAMAGFGLLYGASARMHLYRDLRDTAEGEDLAAALDAREEPGG
jgi:hypothetical protein